MKKLVPNPNLNAEVWVPEDGVDRRTAASLEPAFQALLDRIQGGELTPPRIRGFKNRDTRIAYSEQRKLTDNGSYLWVVQTTYTPYFQRIDLATMDMVALSPPGTIYTIRVNPNTNTLLAAIDVGGVINVYRSTDLGDTWTQVLGGLPVRPYFGFNGTEVLAGGSQYVWLSADDGATWTAYTANMSTGTWQDAPYWGGKWFIYAGVSAVVSSPDGVTWTQETPSGANVMGRFVEHGGYLYAPTAPVVRWDAALNKETLAIDALSHFGPSGGRVYYWENRANDSAMIDIETGEGAFCPLPKFFSDNYPVWESGIAKW